MLAAKKTIHILGGGPAGMATAFYLDKISQPFELYEASDGFGGNARTIWHGDYGVDTGAHRFHDVFPDITSDIKELMGKSLLPVSAPSQIFYKGKFIDFPLSPLDVFMKIGLRDSVIALGQIAGGLLHGAPPANFEALALTKYGRFLADAFLLGYSRKLWGVSPSELSVEVAGKRLKGLSVLTAIKEAFAGKAAKTEHLDGAFYYPEKGIGELFQKMSDVLPRKSLHTNTQVEKIWHDGRTVTALQVGGKEVLSPDFVVNTLPLTVLARMMAPAPPAPVLDALGKLKFRYLLLGVFFLAKPFFSPNASLYFPDTHCPFTRIYESKRRSLALSPEHTTSIAVEIPVFNEDPIFSYTENEIKSLIESYLFKNGLLSKKDILGFSLHRIPYAYPVLKAGYEKESEKVLAYFSTLTNLTNIGRSAGFKYVHIHDLMKDAKSFAQNIHQ